VFLSNVHSTLQQSLMPEMHGVELADCYGRWSEILGNFLGV
jgi:hypothetical protein